MKKKTQTHSPQKRLDRVFRITRKHNKIDLTGSVAIINGEASEKNFENEVFQVTFTTGSRDHKKHYSIFMSPSESISEEEIQNLKKTLGIQISGDGSQFKIDSFEKDFKLSFDLHNSISIDSLGVKKGIIHFRKNKFSSKKPSLPYHKRKLKDTQ